jgi:Zn-finger nucleic acid-binding protein
MPASLNCPNCGASVSSLDATRCGYCHSVLTTVACPSCLGQIFAGMEYCPHCGAKTARAITNDTALSCPDCKSVMSHVHVGGSEFLECPDCAGTWLDADTFIRLCTDREERGTIVATVAMRRPAVTPRRETRVHYRKCPVCGSMMNRQNFGARSGVVLDVCKGHGAWLEQGELQAAMTFIDSGGLEYARRMDMGQRTSEHRRLLDELDNLMRRK